MSLSRARAASRPEPMDDDIVNFRPAPNSNNNPSSPLDKSTALRQILKSKKRSTISPSPASPSSSQEQARTETPLRSMDITQKQKIVRPEQIGDPCPDHPAVECNLWCVEDNTLICYRCSIFGPHHKGHEVVEERAAEFLENFLKTIEVKVENIDKKIEDIKGKFRDSVEKLKSRICQALDKEVEREISDFVRVRVKSLEDLHVFDQLNQLLDNVTIADGKFSSRNSPWTVEMSKLVVKFGHKTDSFVQPIYESRVEASSAADELGIEFSPVADNNSNIITIEDNKSPSPESNFISPEEVAVENVHENNTGQLVVAEGDIEIRQEEVIDIQPNREEQVKIEITDTSNDENADGIEDIDIVYVESPDCIHIRQSKYTSLWESFKRMLNQEAGDVLRPEDFAPSRGSNVLVIHAGSWHRAVVKALLEDQGEAKLKLIDVGRVVNMKTTSLFPLPNKLKQKECYTETVKVAGIMPAGSKDWTQTAIEALKLKLLTDGDYKMKRLDTKKNVEIYLPRSNSKNPFDVAVKTYDKLSVCLVKKGVALKKTLPSVSTARMTSRMSPQFDDDQDSVIVSVQCQEETPTKTEDAEAAYSDNTLTPFSILPSIPSKQIFSAVVTNIDDYVTVWVVAEDNMVKLAEIEERCKKATKIAMGVDEGCLYIAEFGRKKVRARVIKLDLEQRYYICVNIDSGEYFYCSGSNLLQIEDDLLDQPGLAIPVKLYGVQKTDVNFNYKELLENLNEPHGFGVVTVAVLEVNVDKLPLPANVWYQEDSKNLSLLLMRRGYVRVIQSFAEWSKEFGDHGLEWLLDPDDELPTLTMLPYPLPLEVGLWCQVRVEGLEYILHCDGREEEPTIEHTDANRVACCFISTSTNFDIEGPSSSSVIGESLRITTKQIESLEASFVNLKEVLRKRDSRNHSVTEFLQGERVLVPYKYNNVDSNGNDLEWCRGWIEHVSDEIDPWITVFFQDYGHRFEPQCKEDLRIISEEAQMEPTFCKELVHEMPNDDVILHNIRREIKPKGNPIFVRIEKITPKGGSCELEEVKASFWKAVQSSENQWHFKLFKIC